jgi:hypothetical protein
MAGKREPASPVATFMAGASESKSAPRAQREVARGEGEVLVEALVAVVELLSLQVVARDQEKNAPEDGKRKVAAGREARASHLARPAGLSDLELSTPHLFRPPCRFSRL